MLARVKHLSSAALRPLTEVQRRYFEPIHWLAESSVKSRNPDKNSTDILCNAVLYNQNSLLEYCYITAEKHKTLKAYLTRSRTSQERLVELTEDMVGFLNRRFVGAASYNFDAIKLHFNAHTGSEPRICIKGNFPVNHIDRIISVMRDSEVGYNSDVDIESNTGFRAVRDSGSFYIENDIPRAVVEGRYINPRIDQNKIRERMSGGGLSIAESVSDSWHKYWRSGDQVRNNSAFYKSTVIIPLTLRESNLSDDFIEKIRVPDIDQVVFGYLCLDHSHANYFNVGRDVSVVSAIASMITSYIVHRMIYTDASQTFSRIIERMSPDFKAEPLEMDDAQRETAESTQQKPSGRPKLAPVDSALLQSLRPDLAT